MFKEKTVVDSMSIDFFENQITGLLGHNGAGKVQFLKNLNEYNISLISIRYFSLNILYYYLRQQQRLCYVVCYVTSL